jgi:hypothetical protein
MSAEPKTGAAVPATDGLRPMTSIQIEQTREFVGSLSEKSQTYWDMVSGGDELSRELHLTAQRTAAQVPAGRAGHHPAGPGAASPVTAGPGGRVRAGWVRAGWVRAGWVRVSRTGPGR